MSARNAIVQHVRKCSRLSFTPNHWRNRALSLVLLFISSHFDAVSQSSGDFRSNGSRMNWSDIAQWQRFDGHSWLTATEYPGQSACASCRVTIQNSHTVVVNVSPAHPVGQLTVGAGSSGTLSFGNVSLTVSGNLQVRTGATLSLGAGSISVTGSTAVAGTVLDASNAGINYFGGLVTKSGGTWRSTAVTNPAHLVFAGGLTNSSGACSLGAATIEDGKTVRATASINFGAQLVVGGAGNLTVAGNGGVGLAGTASSLIQGDLSIMGGLVVSTAGNFTVRGNTNITGAGYFTDNNNTGITQFTGTVVHNSTGKWTSTVVSNPAKMLFLEGFDNRAGAFTAGGATVGDDKALNGNTTMTFFGGLNVLGRGVLTINGTAGRGVVFGGTGANYETGDLVINAPLVVSTTGNLTVSGTTSINSTGSFSDNNGSGTTTFAASISVASTATFNSARVTTAGNMVCNGDIFQQNANANAFVAGTITSSGANTWSGNGGITISGVLQVLSGEVTNRLSAGLQLGSLIGGVLRQTQNAQLFLTGVTPLDLGTLDATATGNTVHYSGSASSLVKGQQYYHLTMSGRGTKTLPAAHVTVTGDLTLNARLTTNGTNICHLHLQGNLIDNNTYSSFRPGSGYVYFEGNALQQLSSAAPVLFFHLVINNPAGVGLSKDITVGGSLRLTAGLLYASGKTVSLNAAATTIRTAGYIIGRELITVPRGSNISRVFDIGDSSGYTPVRLSFARVSVRGNIAVGTAGIDHPQIGSATLDELKSINRYWSMSNVNTVFNDATATFNYLDSDKDPGVNNNQLIAGSYSNGWNYPVVNATTSNSITVAVSSFGDYAFAELLLCRTPQVVVNTPASICKDGAVDLTDTTLYAGSTPGLQYSFWQDSLLTIPLLNPAAAAAGTYYAKGTTAVGGCYAAAPITVTQHPVTSAVLGGSATVCSGSSTNLSIQVQGSGPWNGALSDGTAFSGSTSPIEVTVSPLVNTSYIIATLNDSFCTAAASDLVGSAAVVVVQRPTPANAGPDRNVCSNSVTLAATPAFSGTGNWAVVSGTGGVVQSPGNPSSVFNGQLGNTYTLRWTTINAPCPSSADLVVISLVGSSWTGAVNTDWNTVGNWCSGVVPTGVFDLVLPAGLPNYPTIATEVSIRNLTIDAGAAIRTAASGKLTITGMYSNAGSIGNAGTVVLKGNAIQAFPGATATVLAMRNLEVDNPAGIRVDQSFSITGTLTPTSGTIRLMDKQITLASNAGGTARVGVVSGSFDYTGGGMFVLQRYFPAKRSWHLVTAPLTNSCSIYDGWQNSRMYTPGRGTFITGTGGLNGLDAGNSSLKIWDPSSQQLVNATSTVVKLSPGTNGSADNQGYFIFMRGDRNPANLNVSNSNATTLVSYGRLQTGAQIFEASAIAGNQTLIGNPYASPIDFNVVARKNVLKRFTVWDPNLGSLGAYVTLDDLDNDGVFTSSVPSSSQTQYIQSHQAFIVETATNGLASITINETSKVGGATSGSRPSAKLARLQLNLLQVKENDIVQLADGALAEFDDGFGNEVNAEDALKFANLGETIALARDGKLLAIERKQLSNEADTLFIETRKLSVGSYHLQMSPSNPGETKLIAMLEDLYSGTATALSLNEPTTVPFTVTGEAASAGANRFRIVFKPAKELPGSITAIDAVNIGENVKLSWTVTNTVGVASFEVSHSRDGVNYEQTRRIYLTANNALPANYEHLDLKVIPGVHYYQVKLHLKNGEEQSSAVARVTITGTKPSIKVYPNPVQDRRIQLTAYNQPGGLYRVKLISSNGQVVLTSTLSIAGRVWNTSFTLPDHVAPGVYHLELSGEKGSVLRETLVVK